VPVTVFGAEPEPAHLAELRDIGVNRAVLYAPPVDAEAVHRFLDQAAPLTAAFSWPLQVTGTRAAVVLARREVGLIFLLTDL
jgi:hypothetical protein